MNETAKDIAMHFDYIVGDPFDADLRIQARIAGREGERVPEFVFKAKDFRRSRMKKLLDHAGKCHLLGFPSERGNEAKFNGVDIVGRQIE
jgi:hypothetical protein